ncbi:Uncharacterized conserved protein, DUF305 family [Amycolatopsis xylanica]|uniref:Uncharacterized conserved protein, DUF305 family n=1 Tax=Amycolatopsis xylanica TaxID=589385 RepID=A0A1H3HRI1_9PSEU|nr:DUF305 domain-containing protein [Amycolatopsis xylanica]SDY18131.1 Uncharacterized conserved protein, DUF305 family [Amycolatopsis xylanica]
MRNRLAGLALLTAVLASGCAGTPAETEPTVPVVLPGKPGDAGTIVPGDQAKKYETKPNQADIDYVTMMIPHHEQAKIMTDLVAAKSSDEQVRSLAGRIAVSQDGEVTLMKEWLKNAGQPVPGPGHDHGGDHAMMPGMATPAQLDALRAATGKDFERMFLDLMIAHHQGALTMADGALANGVDQKAQEMAQHVVTGQSAEIERMKVMRTRF